MVGHRRWRGHLSLSHLAEYYPGIVVGPSGALALSSDRDVGARAYARPPGFPMPCRLLRNGGGRTTIQACEQCRAEIFSMRFAWHGPDRRLILVRAWVKHPPPMSSPGGCGAQVAQLVEHATENRSVGGSIPPLGTIIKTVAFYFIDWGSSVRSGCDGVGLTPLGGHPEVFVGGVSLCPRPARPARRSFGVR